MSIISDIQIKYGLSFERAIAYVEKNYAPVVHGAWTVGYEMCDKSILYDCSECGRTIAVKNGQSLKDYPYCHCGAKMDGKDGTE